MGDYFKRLQQMKLGNETTIDRKKAIKMNSAQWFAFQIEEAEKQGNTCECCGDDLDASKIINPRTIIAHILSKSKFPNAALATLNRAFMCASCHAKYDAMSSEEIAEMPLYQKELKARVLDFYPLLTEAEKALLPACFRLDAIVLTH